MSRGVACALLLTALQAVPAQSQCPSSTLPAYAHNDYANRRPLRDAVELGFRGVEADVFLIGDSLRVGHDRRAAAVGPTLESSYLRPLRDIAGQCMAAADVRPFLLFVEMKEETPPTRTELGRVLAASAPQLGSRVEIVLVGRLRGAPVDSVSRLTGAEFSMARPADRPPRCERIRLISIDFGKTMGHWWVRESGRNRWYDSIKAIRRACPSAMIRAHNVPVDREVYDALLGAGVDLIGTKDLAGTRRLLTAR